MANKSQFDINEMLDLDAKGQAALKKELAKMQGGFDDKGPLDFSIPKPEAQEPQPEQPKGRRGRPKKVIEEKRQLTNFYATREMKSRLDEAAAKIGTSVSNIVAMAVSAWLRENNF